MLTKEAFFVALGKLDKDLPKMALRIQSLAVTAIAFAINDENSTPAASLLETVAKHGKTISVPALTAFLIAFAPVKEKKNKTNGLKSLTYDADRRASFTKDFDDEKGGTLPMWNTFKPEKAASPVEALEMLEKLVKRMASASKEKLLVDVKLRGEAFGMDGETTIQSLITLMHSQIVEEIADAKKKAADESNTQQQNGGKVESELMKAA